MENNFHLKNLHPKIVKSITTMFLDPELNYQYYAEFNMNVNFHERKDDPNTPTAGVNVTNKGLNFYYNPDFLDKLNQKEVNFLVHHETDHLLFKHPMRARLGGFDPMISNYAMDMIINYLIEKHISHNFIEVIKNEEGKNTALFPPKEYEGELIFEKLYDFIVNKKEESENRRKKKEDEKLFNELSFIACQPYKPILTDYKGMYNNFIESLTKKSHKEAVKYFDSFSRRCFQVIEGNTITGVTDDTTIYLYSNTSSIIPENTTNQKLSDDRGFLFKLAVLDILDKNIVKNTKIISIIKNEMEGLKRGNIIEYIIKYEELDNIMKKQRLVELESLDDEKINAVFVQYRHTQLSFYSDKDIDKIIDTRKLTIEVNDEYKKMFMNIADKTIKVESLVDTDPIIENEREEGESKVSEKYADNPRYKYYKFVKLPAIKQEINRRASYKFPESCDNGNMGGGSSPESNDSEYGEYGKDGMETYSLDELFNKADEGEPITLDKHMEDEVDGEMRDKMVGDIHNALKNRGLCSAHMEEMLGKLRKKKKDHLKEIKRGVSYMKGTQKVKTFSRPNRKNIPGMKGRKKLGTKLTVLLDVSGSMSGGYIEKALSFAFRSDIVIDLIQCDTEIKKTESIKSMKELQNVKLIGFGGTELQPGIEYAKQNLPRQNMLILTDGYCDSLDFSGFKKKCLIISVGTDVNIKKTNGKVKQILADDD